MDNVGDRCSSLTYVDVTIDEDMWAFDQLPRDWRDWLNECPVEISPMTVLEAISRWGNAKAVAHRPVIVGQVLEKLREEGLSF